MHISWLIAAYGPDRLVSFTLARRPNSIVVATLSECLSIDSVITGGAVTSFTLVGKLPPLLSCPCDFYALGLAVSRVRLLP